jgi:hypothetical protein
MAHFRDLIKMRLSRQKMVFRKGVRSFKEDVPGTY